MTQMAEKIFVPNDTWYRKFVNTLKSSYTLLVLAKLLNPGRRVEINNIERDLRKAESRNDIILDVVCGDGYWTRYFSKFVNRAYGIEPYEVDLKKAQRYANPKTEFVGGTAEKMNFDDGTFNKVVSVCVFEHLYNDVEAFREFNRVLKQNGSVYATVDSLQSPYVTAEHTKWHMDACYCKQLYTTESITEKLKRAGFRHVEAYYILGSRISVFWEVTMEKMGVFAFFMLPFFYPAILLLERKPRPSGYKIFVKATK
jgi:ubiquinone/menaquinone biosynthesis C-methylase UbiE